MRIHPHERVVLCLAYDSASMLDGRPAEVPDHKRQTAVEISDQIYHHLDLVGDGLLQAPQETSAAIRDLSLYGQALAEYGSTHVVENHYIPDSIIWI